MSNESKQNEVGMKKIGDVPENEAKRFEVDVIEKTRQMMEENDRWKAESLEKSFSHVLR